VSHIRAFVRESFQTLDRSERHERCTDRPRAAQSAHAKTLLGLSLAIFNQRDITANRRPTAFIATIGALSRDV
jgi:hypothetical protein